MSRRSRSRSPGARKAKDKRSPSPANKTPRHDAGGSREQDKREASKSPSRNE